MQTVSTISTSPAHTARLAAALAPLLRAGDILVLRGGLAAGKTWFVQNLVRALGSSDDALSPTFAIANFYDTSAAPFIHVDAYRLSGPQEYADLGLDEFIPASITAIEWGDRLPGAFDEYLDIALEACAGADESRVVSLRPVGPRWTAAAEDLARLGG